MSQFALHRYLDGYSLGTGALVRRHPLSPSGMVNAIFLQMKFLENTTTDTTMQMMIDQLMATNGLTIKLNKKTVFEIEEPEDWVELLDRRGSILNPLQGGGTDDRVAYLSIVAPFGRIFPWCDGFSKFADRDYGLPITRDSKLEVLLNSPADGNNIDTRTLSIDVLEYIGGQSKGFISTTKHLGTSDVASKKSIVEGIEYGDALYAWLFFQTTELSVGTTTDLSSIEAIQPRFGSIPVGFPEIEVESDYMAVYYNADGEHADDEYLYHTYDPQLDLQGLPARSAPLNFRIDYGDTNAVRLLLNMFHRDLGSLP